MRWSLRMLKRVAVLIAAVFLLFIGARIYDIAGGPPLDVWHKHVPKELTAAELDSGDWAGYLAAEDAIFDEVRREVAGKLDEEDRVPVNRYFEGSPVNPTRFAKDWNRSFVLEPPGPPRGAALFLHGLTDSPYSLRHVAEIYRDAGYVAIGLRLPGHGTVPAGLTAATWEQWMAATRLAMREVRRRAGEGAPIEIVGYSNGGALALLYAVDALTDDALVEPARIVLFSPMVGITRFARFAGLAGLPAILPAFARAAWLDLLPEFNPFKYNSFPVNAATQSFQLTMALQSAILDHAKDNRLDGLAPVLAFQSVMDSTVNARALVTELFDRLPRNGSELVLFDINRNAELGLLLRPTSETSLATLLSPAPRSYGTTVVANENASSAEVVARVTPAGSDQETVQPLGLSYPPDVFSLSHVAMPFPITDGLYGMDPDPADNFGVRLGALAARGERGVLIVSLDWLLRMSSNPFFPYVADRIRQWIGAPAAAEPTAAPAPVVPAEPPAPAP